VNCAALRNLHDTCVERHATYTATTERLTSSVRSFRRFEQTVTDVARFPLTKHLLVLLVLLGALSTTTQRMHIALREAASPLEHRLSQGLQLVAHGFLLVSCVEDYRVLSESGAAATDVALPVLWAVGFGLLALINVVHLVKLPDGLEPAPPNPARLLMVIPLYVYMALIAGFYFTLVEQHPSGQAIFLHKFVQHPTIYIGIGLYIWAGMMLARTRIAPLAFDTLMPLKLPPVLLAWLVIVLAALPTAYSGASGIFVIAAGAVIFERLTAAGASPRIAMAATAMSGSLGVVLRPCLVVVLVAVLNKQVTTDELFSRGLQVFALTVVLALIALLWRNDQPLRLPNLGEALPEIGRKLRPLLPYTGLAIAVLVFYRLVLDTTVNEHTAAMVLPAVMLALLVYDRTTAPAAVTETPPAEAQSTAAALRAATSESSDHIGALLMVMVGSVGLGGVVERAEVMSLVPESFGSPFLTMVVLVVIMVLVGMTMDALGAVVLVSVTVAQIAYANDIDPVHFWMMVLCAFELGYLTPPVALNHLLARQVIGPASHVEVVDPQEGFFASYEHVILPMMIMGTALVLVAFVPLLFY
jgi:TRAP-type C4-dicarboxylate transport system permease large subunit